MNAEAYFQSLNGKNVTVIGYGVSNRPLVEILLSYGANVKICDKKTKEKLGAEISEYEKRGVKLSLGETYLDDVDGDVIIKTPGIRGDKPEILAAAEKGAVVTSEMELFFELCPCRKIAVTGSDGKTTTTTLIYNLLKNSGYTCHLGGNIGIPLLPVVRDVKESDMAVVELSSFQLHAMKQSADIAVIKNITPNHLDWHTDMDEYINSKKHVYQYQNSDGILVLNYDDPITRRVANEAKGKVKWFSMKEKVPVGTYLSSDGTLFYTDGVEDTLIMHKSDIRLVGDHNVENYLTAIAAVWGMVSIDVIRTLAKEFGGVEHRMEYVRTYNGVDFYNDAIATSPTRAIACLKSQDKPIVLIAGGYDKKVPFDPIAPYINTKVKALVLYGATGDKIEAAVKADSNYCADKLIIDRAYSMAEAVTKAYGYAEKGDRVYMSPASASFDRYQNFEFCGRDFKEKVNNIEKYL